MAKKDTSQPRGFKVLDPPESLMSDQEIESGTKLEVSKKHARIMKKHVGIPKTDLSIIGVFFLTLLILSSYSGVSFYKNQLTDKVVAEEASSIHVDPFSADSVISYANANPDSPLTAKLEKILKSPITFQFGGSTFIPSASDVASWMVVNTDDRTHISGVTQNSTSIDSYVNNFIAQNTHKPTEQQLATHPDGSSDILVKGIDGQTLSQPDQAEATIDNNILNGQPFTVTFPTSTLPYTQTSSPLFSKLLEVDLTSKTMWAYENGVLVNTFLVSAGAPLTPTPTGTFHIFEKLLSQNMSGFNYNGTPYFQPNVPYVNYFDGSDAIHGNYWRPASYFGNINSSHGCVGVQVSEAKWIYNWAPIGTTVIVHK